jgi:hypothetical protein
MISGAKHIRAARCYEDEWWQEMLGVDLIASTYGWTYEQIQETPDEVLEALTVIRGTRVRIFERKQRMSNLLTAVEAMQPQPKPRITAGRL